MYRQRYFSAFGHLARERHIYENGKENLCEAAFISHNYFLHHRYVRLCLRLSNSDSLSERNKASFSRHYFPLLHFRVYKFSYRICNFNLLLWLGADN